MLGKVPNKRCYLVAFNCVCECQLIVNVLIRALLRPTKRSRSCKYNNLFLNSYGYAKAESYFHLVLLTGETRRSLQMLRASKKVRFFSFPLQSVKQGRILDKTPPNFISLKLVRRFARKCCRCDKFRVLVFASRLID